VEHHKVQLLHSIAYFRLFT